MIQSSRKWQIVKNITKYNRKTVQSEWEMDVVETFDIRKGFKQDSGISI